MPVFGLGKQEPGQQSAERHRQTELSRQRRYAHGGKQHRRCEHFCASGLCNLA